MKNVLVTTGFPRSGNTFLNYALQALFYPTETVNLNNHTVLAMDKYEKVLVPFRNPADAISSWNYYPSGHELNDDIKFYVRMYTEALKRNNVIFVDFDLLINDLNYIKNLIKSNFGFDPIANPSMNDIKSNMLNDYRERNLPNKDKENAKTAIKEKLIVMPEFESCVTLFNQLKSK